MVMESRKRRLLNDAIRLDAEGTWYQGEYPIFHERTVSYLYKNIVRHQNGHYYLIGDEKPIPIQVEDVAYWVCKIQRTMAGYLVTLTDGSIELMDLKLTWMGKGNVLYCLVKDGEEVARFQRPAFYEIMKDLSIEDGHYCLKVGSKVVPIARKAPEAESKLKARIDATRKNYEKSLKNRYNRIKVDTALEKAEGDMAYLSYAQMVENRKTEEERENLIKSTPKPRTGRLQKYTNLDISSGDAMKVLSGRDRSSEGGLKATRAMAPAISLADSRRRAEEAKKNEVRSSGKIAPSSRPTLPKTGTTPASQSTKSGKKPLLKKAATTAKSSAKKTAPKPLKKSSSPTRRKTK
jgi:hypothetical protein